MENQLDESTSQSPVHQYKPEHFNDDQSSTTSSDPIGTESIKSTSDDSSVDSHAIVKSIDPIEQPVESETDRLLTGLDPIGLATGISSAQHRFCSSVIRSIGPAKPTHSSIVSRSSNPDGYHEKTAPPIEYFRTKLKLGSKVGTGKTGDSTKHDVSWSTKSLIDGITFDAKYLGSTQLICEGQPNKFTRLMQAEQAVEQIKAPDGESQPTTPVILSVSTEKVEVFHQKLKNDASLMEYTLKTIMYIADIGDLVVLMVKRHTTTRSSDLKSPEIDPTSPDEVATTESDSTSPDDHSNKSTDSECETMRECRKSQMICHVFESDDARLIAQSIGQAFQVAYNEFLKSQGIEDENFFSEIDYQEVLNSQYQCTDELDQFARKDCQKDVVIRKGKGEILGLCIVESGWGSLLPTVVIANLMANGAATRCNQLSIGDQIISINGLSLVGLPMQQCQEYMRNVRQLTAVPLTIVPCAPVVVVRIRRPTTKYQLGFSVQNGVICSLLRGGIAERGGVRVGHRIIEINNESVVAVTHDRIVQLLTAAVGEICMKTMPITMFKLLTGQKYPDFI